MKVAFDFIYGMYIVLKETITLKKEHVGGGNLSHLWKWDFPLPYVCDKYFKIYGFINMFA